MRLHRLRLTAFGPFAAETTVDFDDLGGDGLFLLHGQTGAGKTTILDAVAFALYGAVPGARGVKRLRSDHAALEEITEVELEATIAGRRLRITRSPEYERPKKRGGGTTPSKARASLTWLDGSGVNLTAMRDIGDAVIDLLGMSAEQFFQVVLLPQGEFANFLRAKPDDREPLLEKLFDTKRFGDLEDWLRDRTRESRAELDEQSRSLDRLASQIVAVHGRDRPAEPDVEWALTCRESARAAERIGSERLAAARARADQAQAALSDGRQLTERQERGAQARTRMTALEAASAELDAAQRSLADARRAAPIAPVIEDHEAAVAAVGPAVAARSDAEGQLSALPEGAALCADESRDAVAKAIQTWTAQSGALEPLVQRVATRDAIVDEIASLERHVSSGSARAVELAALLDQAPGRRDDIEARVRDAREAQVRVPALESERIRITALVGALAERAAAVADLAQTDRALITARDEYNSARATLLDLREKRINGMAAELAGHLVDGEECVVCGSVQHPRPAVGHGPSVSDADETAASRAEQTAAAKRDKASDAHAAVQRRLVAIDATLAGESAESVDERRVANIGQLTEAQESAGRLVAQEQALVELDAQIESWRKELGEKQASVSALREKVAGRRADLTDLDTAVHDATGGRFGVAQRRDELVRLSHRAQRLQKARDDESRALARRDEAAQRLERLCADADFPDVAAARHAVAGAEQIAVWERAITTAAEMRARCAETLSDKDVQAALAVEPVDVDALTEAMQAAATDCDAAAGQHGALADGRKNLEQFVVEFGEHFEALGPARERHAELEGLATLVAGKGQNSRKISLRSYVLAARLQEVLIAASTRLRQMSSGRYEFVHDDSAGTNGRTGGLGIRVHDEYTGKERETSTLSGGETFFASLALALGLADVVSAEAGGRALDTIFIDEGFGTLDPETLDLVMGVLDELRSGGRVIGVVSHVDEMRARIPSQLHVIRGEDGSRIKALGTVGTA